MSFEKKLSGSISELLELKAEAEELLDRIETLLRELPKAINEQEAIDTLDKYELHGFKHIEIF